MKTYRIYENVSLGEGSVVEDFCIVGTPPRGAHDGRAGDHSIGAGAVIRSHTVIYAGNVIGRNFQTGNKVNIRESNRIGDNVSVGTLSVDRAPCGDRRQRPDPHAGVHSRILRPRGGLLDWPERRVDERQVSAVARGQGPARRSGDSQGRQDRRQRHAPAWRRHRRERPRRRRLRRRRATCPPERLSLATLPA